MAATAQLQVRRRPGRPRDEDLEQLVLDAALEKIDEVQEMTVSKLVERSGVSRAAIYRRWPSMPLLISSSLNSGRVVQPAITVDEDLRQKILDSYIGKTAAQAAQLYSESRFRHRIRLVIADRELQRTYWEPHVKRHGIPVEDALREAVSRGMPRSDLDAEACFDTLAGAAYH